MCDYSLHAVASRPAKVGETLITTTFRGTSTRGFAAAAEPEVAVCLLPGTELAFEDGVKYDHRWIWKKSTGFKVARFRKVELNVSHQHHDAIEFPNGSERRCCSCPSTFKNQIQPLERWKDRPSSAARFQLLRFEKLF